LIDLSIQTSKVELVYDPCGMKSSVPKIPGTLYFFPWFTLLKFVEFLKLSNAFVSLCNILFLSILLCYLRFYLSIFGLISFFIMKLV
jgi:hypothetical protein